MKVSLQDIQAARESIKNFITVTPCDLSRSLSQAVAPNSDTEIYLKLENYQRTGSFKMRGASNKLAHLTEAERLKGVIACSAGNHAQGVALSASLNKVKSVIVMPETAPLSKIDATQNYGAEVILKGQSFDEAKEHAFQLAREKGYTFVHPYEDEQVIAGQGTIGLEMFEQIAGLEQVIIPIGGGGMISGIAIALKSLNPKIQVIGVQSENVSTMQQLFKKQTTPPSPAGTTIADGIAVKTPSLKMFEFFIAKYVDDIVTVSEGEIAAGIVFLLERAKTVAEGAGATAVAALLSKKVKPMKKSCAIVCGGNIDLNIVAQVIARGQIQRGRLAEMAVIVSDTPGSLARLTQVLADSKANIIEVHHDRVKQGLSLKETRIEFVIEAIGHKHIQQIRENLIAAGARVIEQTDL